MFGFFCMFVTVLKCLKFNGSTVSYFQYQLLLLNHILNNLIFARAQKNDTYMMVIISYSLRGLIAICRGKLHPEPF